MAFHANFNGAAHYEQIKDQLIDHLSNSPLSDHLKAVALTGNAAVNGGAMTGCAQDLSPDTPLAKLSTSIGTPMCGRVGVYRLAREPEHMNTVRKAEAFLATKKVADEIDDIGETYGGYSVRAPSEDTPWAPEFHNDQPHGNMIHVARARDNASDFVVSVRTNAAPQMAEAIQMALAENADATVGEFIASPLYKRVADASSLQNKRVMHNYCTRANLEDAVPSTDHQTLRTDAGPYGAAVRYAVAASMSSFNDIMSNTDGTVRVTNGAIDLRSVDGDSLPLVASPLAGMTLVTPRGDSSKLTVASSQTLGAVALEPRQVAPIKMGADEMDHARSVLHMADKSDTAVTQVMAQISQVDPRAEAFSDSALQAAGLRDYTRKEYKTIACVVIP